MIRHGVSIIICCHNGASRLRETVRHIALQEVPDYIPWELILVDNASTDDSIDVVREEWDKHSSTGELRIVQEPVLGLSHARARGFDEAWYNFMIMCDDDNWLARDYVERVYHVMTEKPNVGALGGNGELVFEQTPPQWIAESQIFAAGAQAERTGRVPKARIYGAGCVIRKSAYERLKKVGFKSLLTDRKGSSLSSGGDYELCYALAILGYDIWYDARLRFKHYITKERLTWEYFVRYAHESSSCFDVLISYKMIALESKTQKFSFLVMGKDFLYSLREMIKVTGKRLATKSTSPEGKLLYFQYVIYLQKLIAYARKFRVIEKNHAKVMEFKNRCNAEKTKATPRYSPTLSITYASKPSLPLR